MLLSGNSILLFFIKLLKNLENQTYILLLLELIYKQLDRYKRQWLSMPSLLPGATMIPTCSTFQSCRLNISDDLQRQGKCSNSCNQIVQPILVYLQLLLMTNHNLLYFWLSLRNLTLPHKTSNGKEPMVLIKRSWTKCMSNQNKHSIYNM